MKSFVVIILCLLLLFNISVLPARAENEIKTIAISEFINNTDLSEFDNLENGLADSLTSNLAKYKSLAILERSRLKEALKELSFSQTGFISPETTVKLGKIVGAEYLILGNILKSGDQYQISLRIVETETGKIRLGESIDFSSKEAIIKSINYLSLKIAASLGENIDNGLIEQEKIKIESLKPETNTFIIIVGGIIITIGIIAGTVISLEFWK